MAPRPRDLEIDGYADLLAELKQRVRTTQFRAARAANAEVLRLYWSIGRDILERQRDAGWGSKVVDRLAADLQREFPDQRGWSRRNLLYMRQAAEVWPTEAEFVHHVGARLPWRHVTVLMGRLKSRDDRDWYAARAAEEGWSRGVLEHQIKVNLRSAIGAAPSNFPQALEAPDSDLAQQLVKDPYVFEHLGLVKPINERNVEQALMDRLQDTMLEFGRGMAFVGRQVRLTVPDDRSSAVDDRRRPVPAPGDPRAHGRDPAVHRQERADRQVRAGRHVIDSAGRGRLLRAPRRREGSLAECRRA